MRKKKPSQDKSAKPSSVLKKDLDKTYNEFKQFEGRVYTGMKIGRRHKWYYDQGEWKERKITPDKWEISYNVKKRRAGKAPKGSGVPVGTEYHWYILAHQNVRKLNANIYSTAMTGVKFKLAHKRSNQEKWSASENAQRKNLIKFLREMIVQLQEAPEEFVEVIKDRLQSDSKKTQPFENDGQGNIGNRPPVKRSSKNSKRVKKVEMELD